MGKRETIYLAPQCHHQTDSCIKMGSDESHFNVSLIVRDKITRQCLQTTTFVKRKRPYQPNVFVTVFQPNEFVTAFRRFLCANYVCYCFSA